jgi:hypothetical protein
MQFFNGTKFEDFIDKDVHVILTSDSEVCDTLPFCHAFLRDGKLCIDLIPQLNNKYVVEVPDDSAFSRNETELSMGRYGILIRSETRAGALILDLLEQKRRYQEGKK